MASPRTWNLRLNLDDFNALTSSLYADADRALVLQGMSLGLNGGALPDGAPSAFCRGWELGHGMRVEAEEFRTAQAERGKSSAAKRLERNGTAQPRKPVGSRTEFEPPFEPMLEPVLEPPVEPNHNPQSTIPLTTNDKPLPPVSPQGGKRERAPRFVPPTEQEWVEYCTTTWNDWHQICAAEFWAYYQGIGWKMRAGPVRDWKATARTAHGNARQWGKLQPQTQQQFVRRPGPASVRAATDQALIDQLEDQKNAQRQTPSESDIPSPSAADTRWFDDAVKAAGA